MCVFVILPLPRVPRAQSTRQNAFGVQNQHRAIKNTTQKEVKSKTNFTACPTLPLASTPNFFSPIGDIFFERQDFLLFRLQHKVELHGEGKVQEVEAQVKALLYMYCMWDLEVCRGL
jgi:hypothetical protein